MGTAKESTDNQDGGMPGGLAVVRSVLAGQQRELVECLVAGGPVPAGFVPEHVAAARRALARKRLGGIGHHFPGLAAGIRSDAAVMDLFLAWHLANRQGAYGSHADSVRLMDFLDGQGRLPEAATRELLLLRMDTNEGSDGRRAEARWFGLRRVVVGGRSWWAAGSSRAYRWVRVPRQAA